MASIASRIAAFARWLSGRSFDGTNFTVPDQSAGDSSTKAANTGFVAAAIAALKDSVSTSYDTLKELADAITANTSAISTNTSNIATNTSAIAALPLTKSYTSGELTISNAGTGTLTHGLGAAPKLVQALLICKTAEQNYAVGDQIVVGTWYQSGADKGVSIYIPNGSTTTIGYRYSAQSAVFGAIDNTTGSMSGLTNANWRMIVKAWA